MSGSQRLSIPTIGLLTCVAQLVAISQPYNLPPTLTVPSWASVSSLQLELAALWHGGFLTYVLSSGLVRVGLLVLIRASSTSTLQLVNALAVPLGVATLTPGLPQNVQALLIALGGGALYLLGQTRLAVPKRNRQRKNFMDELMQEKKEQKRKKAVEPVPKQNRQRMNFMDELRQEKKEKEKKKAGEPETPRQDKLLTWQEQQERNKNRLEAQQQERKKQERLRRMQQRWARQEEQQRESDQQQSSEPLMYADDDK